MRTEPGMGGKCKKSTEGIDGDTPGTATDKIDMTMNERTGECSEEEQDKESDKNRGEEGRGVVSTSQDVVAPDNSGDQEVSIYSTIETTSLDERFGGDCGERSKPCESEPGKVEIIFENTDEKPLKTGNEGRVCLENDNPRQRRIEALRQQAETLCGARFVGEGIGRLPAEMEEGFWRQIIAYETAEPADLIDLLTKGGVTLPESVLVSETHISDRLWEVIYFLSSLGCYIENTDHLSDRELYVLLRDKLLLEPVILFPEDPNYAYHIDTIGSGSDEDQLIYLTYYATEKDRALWARNWPDDQLPARLAPPFDRDRLLPRPSPRHPGLLM